ncbi:hypothetical protein [Spirosoma radiotolerans]|nr:hypothetical protein [Spirosoma radiotolerans]
MGRISLLGGLCPHGPLIQMVGSLLTPLGYVPTTPEFNLIVQ